MLMLMLLLLGHLPVQQKAHGRTHEHGRPDKMILVNLVTHIQVVMERNGEPVVTTMSGIRYEANQLLGTPAEPTVINFVSISTMPQDGNWYTLSGILLPQKPTQAGLYIFNGKVQVIK